jgi:hypothetical protein
VCQIWIDRAAALVQHAGMSAKRFSPLYLATLLSLCTLPVALHGQVAFDTERTTIAEEATPDPTLKFKYRLIPDAVVKTTEVLANGTAIESRSTPYIDNPLNTAALLIMVDTSIGSSKQPRARTIELNKQAISQLLNQTTPRNLVGLDSFDNDLVELSPIGTPFAEARAKLADIKATGLGTRLYRRAIDAIEKLTAVKADRKALLIFSDGKDEDTGFTLDDLLKSAKENNIMIMAVGCPESPEGIPALGNLERAAAETSGFYVQMDLPPQGGPQNPANLAQSLLSSLDSGAEVVASLKDVAPDAELIVNLTTADGQVLTQSLTRSPAPATDPAAAASPSASPASDQDPAADPAATASPAPDATPEPTPIPTASERALDWIKKNQASVIAGGVAFLALLGILFAALGKRRKTEPQAEAFIEDFPTAEPFSEPVQTAGNPSMAWLVMQDADATKVGLNKTASRIGRRQDNDIVFSNDSVSGHHAEIHMGRDGSFTITDLNSGNGVLINGKRVTQSPLRDGDIVELGEVGFRFSLNP